MVNKCLTWIPLHDGSVTNYVSYLAIATIDYVIHTRLLLLDAGQMRGYNRLNHGQNITKLNIVKINASDLIYIPNLANSSFQVWSECLLLVQVRSAT